MNHQQANAAAERELDRDLNRHLDDLEPPVRSYVVTCEITIEATSVDDAAEQLHRYWNLDLAGIDLIDTDIIGVKEQ